MSRKKLALFGGPKEFNFEVHNFNSIGDEEISAVVEVMKTGILSKYIGAPGIDFMGGPKVRELEEEFSTYFGVKHAIAVNSWTSGLIASVGAIQVEPGDEIILSPWTMSACAMAILHWNAIPIFADVSKEDFCLDLNDLRKKITPKTRAIMVIDIFGQSAKMEEYRKIADEYCLKLISDSAQSPGARYSNSFAGTLADIGGISLNYHKHIHSGEGGIIFTNDDLIARRLQLIRNHAESVVTGEEASLHTNMLGYNFRLGEIEAAIALEQLKKLSKITNLKQDLANLLTRELSELKGLGLPSLSEDYRNVFYVYPMVLDHSVLGVERSVLVRALRAEGVPGLFEGYQNLHLLPVFQNLKAFGSTGWPWTSEHISRNLYKQGTLPVAEELHSNSFLGLGITGLDFNETHIRSIANAFKKIWANLEFLK